METIGGKRVEDVMDELCSPFYQSEVRQNVIGEKYHSADTIQRRLERVLGKYRWSFTMTGHYLKEIDHQLYSIGSGTVTIFTDEGKQISRSASGCVELYGTPKQLFVNFDEYATAICDEIFVQACRKLGIGLM